MSFHEEAFLVKHDVRLLVLFFAAVVDFFIVDFARRFVAMLPFALFGARWGHSVWALQEI